jgi:predicted nucleotidyltransferase
MKTFFDLSAEERSVLADLQRRIRDEFPRWSLVLTLFGSRARGDAEADSDMDVMVEIGSDRISFEEKRRLRRLAGDISASSGIVLSLLIADRETLESRGEFSIFRNIREEGLAL